jgi:hypothetical protein
VKGEARRRRVYLAGDRVVLREDRRSPGRLIFLVRKVYARRGELEVMALNAPVPLSRNRSGAWRAWSALFTHDR